MNTRPPNDGDMIEAVSTQTELDVTPQEEIVPPAIVHIVCCDDGENDDVALCGEDVSNAFLTDSDETSCLMCTIAFRRGNCPKHVTCLYPIFGEGQVGGRQ